MELAPIAFFAYKRPDHTLRSLTSLSECFLSDKSHLYIFCDGPKSAADELVVQEVSRIVRSKRWCKEVEVIYREQNAGLSTSVIEGTTYLCERYGSCIVLEDDLLLTPGFLEYMNNALQLYENTSRVMQVSGFIPKVSLATTHDALFLPFTTSWGWATWKRAWEYFDPTASLYSKLKLDRALRHKFNLNGHYNYFDLLERQLRGEIDSWAIRWYLSVCAKDGLVLFPKQSLVDNLGFDGSGTHCAGKFMAVDLNRDFVVVKFPEKIEVSREQDKVFKAVSKISGSGLKDKLRTIFSSLRG